MVVVVTEEVGEMRGRYGRVTGPMMMTSDANTASSNTFTTPHNNVPRRVETDSKYIVSMDELRQTMHFPFTLSRTKNALSVKCLRNSRSVHQAQATLQPIVGKKNFSGSKVAERCAIHCCAKYKPSDPHRSSYSHR